MQLTAIATAAGPLASCVGSLTPWRCLSVEEARPTDGSERGGPIGSYRLRYGLKF